MFDRKYGTVTAGKAATVSDGASALLVMREDRAKALGRNPIGYLAIIFHVEDREVGVFAVLHASLAFG